MLEANGIKNMTILIFRRNMANGRPLFNLDVTGLGHFIYLCLSLYFSKNGEISGPK
jgi:hypothetical protein